MTHSLRYFYTASSGVANFPEFVSLLIVDEHQLVHYDSTTRKAESTQKWMKQLTAEDPEYLERSTTIFMSTQPIFKSNIEVVKQRFNQTGGLFVFPLLYVFEN